MQISVSGEQHVRVPPERADLNLAASLEGSDRAALTRRVSEAVAGLTDELTALREAGAIERFSVQPLRVFSWKANRIGQRVHVTADLAVTFVDFEELGRFTAEVGRRDGVRIGGVDWRLTDESADRLRDECIAGAVARATKRAEAMARAAGKDAVEIVEIADPGLLGEAAIAFGAPVAGAAFRARGAAAPDDSGFEVIPEDIEIGALLNLRFVTG